MSVDELTQLASDEEPRRPGRGTAVLLTLTLLVAAVAVILARQGDARPLAQLRIQADSVEARNEGTDFRAGVEGEALDDGDAVRTSGTGQARVDYFDGSQTNLDSGTTLTIGALINEPGTRSISIDQSNGRLWHTVERLTSSQDRYEVRTPNAVASVHGTWWVSDGRWAPKWYFLVFDGSMTVETKAGQAFQLSTDDCVRVNEDGTMRRCTDHELENLLDNWINSLIAYGGGTPTGAPTVEPSPTATGAPATGGRGTGTGFRRPAATTPAPTAAPPRTRKPSINTPCPDEDECEEDEEPTESPSSTPTTPPTETPVDCMDPGNVDHPDCQGT